MTAGPQPLTLDCAALGCGLPEEELSLDQMRVLLLKRQTSWVTKDAVWQELVQRAHATPEPRSSKAFSKHSTSSTHGHRRSSGSSTGPHSGAATKPPTAKGGEQCPGPNSLTPQSTPRTAGGHPDLILAGALFGVITPREAHLVSDLLLDHGDRSSAAKRRGMSRHQVAVQLNTVSRHVADYLRRPPSSGRMTTLMALRAPRWARRAGPVRRSRPTPSGSAGRAGPDPAPGPPRAGTGGTDPGKRRARQPGSPVPSARSGRPSSSQRVPPRG
jgi:hypothetical protein